MGLLLRNLGLVVVILSLASLKVLACANHPPEKTSGSSASSTVSQPTSSNANSESEEPVSRVLGSVRTNSGTRAFSNEFFGTSQPVQSGRSEETKTSDPSADSWSSATQ